jgi:thymidylate kinase
VTPVPLVARLGAALASRGVRYCQWKGHGKRERWENGRGDIDLLVDRTSWNDFTDVVGSLGFKHVLPPPGREAAGIVHCFGLDERTGQLVHLHVYQRLVIGSPWRTHYRLPVEAALLDSAQQSTVFKTATPELELIVLVLRQALRHELRDLLRREPPRWMDGAISELDRLEDQVSRARVVAALRTHLPSVSLDLFDQCRDSLLPHSKPWHRVVARERLFRALAPLASRASVFAPLERFWERIRPLVTGGREGHRLSSGGSVVALLGGDGSGKSTCADALCSWLGSSLATMHVHLGRPARSLATYVVGGLLAAMRRIGPKTRLAAHLEVLRYACTARDRYAQYARAHRFASSGGIAICERYPLPESWALSGPSETQDKGLEAQSRFAEAVRRRERRFYERMTAPDLLFVLHLDPETAVSRKPSEPADYVRKRAQLTAETDWSKTGARIVDAAQPLPQVVATLKEELWSAL